MEHDALVLLSLQFLSLGQSELTQWMLRRLCELDLETGQRLLREFLQLGCLPFEFVQLPSHQTTRIQWSFVTGFKEMGRLTPASVLKIETSVILDELGRDGRFSQSDWVALKDGMNVLFERMEQRSVRRRSLDGNQLQSAVGRVVKISPVVTRSLIWMIQGVVFESYVPKEWTQFRIMTEKSCIASIETAMRSGRSEEAFEILSMLQGDVAVGDVTKLLKYCVKQMESNPWPLVQSAMANPRPLLSTFLQLELDAALRNADDPLNPKDVLFSENRSSWRSKGFQEARVHGWHVEGLKLETIVKDIQLGKFELLQNWKPGNRRLLSIAVLMGWDVLSAQDTASTFPLKKVLVESMYPKVPSGSHSELTGAVASLFAKLQFSELLSRCIDPEILSPGELLTKLKTIAPHQLLSEHFSQLDTRFVKAVAALTSRLELDIQSPFVRDLYLILSSGVLSAIAGFLLVSADVLNNDGEISIQDMWLSEMKDLIDTVHACLCAMQGTFVHAWLLSIVNSILYCFMMRPDLFTELEATFMHLQNKPDSIAGLELLKMMRDLVEVLERSTEWLNPESDSWTDGVISAHLATFDAFYSNLSLALNFLIQSGTETAWKILKKGNWKELGGFLMLPMELHQLLMDQVIHFQSDIDRIQYAMLDPYLDLPLEIMPSVLDVLVKKSLTVQASLPYLEYAIQKLNAATSLTPIQESSLNVLQRLQTILEPLQKTGADFTLSDLSDGHRSIQKGPLIETGHVRKILAHLKAITRLKDALKDLFRGRLRYLSGLLHNLSRALSDSISQLDARAFLEVAGYGPDVSTSQTASDNAPSSVSYLSLMVQYLAEVGDIVSTMDDGPTEGHNYFAVLHQRPQETLVNVIGCCQSAKDMDHAMAAADVFGVDLAHEALTTWLDPLYPPNDLHEKRIAEVTDAHQRMPNLEAMKALAASAPERVMLASAFANLQKRRRVFAGKNALEDDLAFLEAKPEPVLDILAAIYDMQDPIQFPTLQNWHQSQCASSKTSSKPESSTIRQNVEEQIRKGELRDAFRVLNEGFDGKSPDDLLKAIVEATLQFPDEDEPDGFFFADGHDPDALNSVPISWVACLRMQNPEDAFEFALKRVRSWSLERSIEFFNLQNDPRSVLWIQKLKLFQRVLDSPLIGEFHNWITIDTFFTDDCAQLVRKLLKDDLTDDALQLIQIQSVSNDLKRDVHAAHVRMIGLGSPSFGNGPIAAIRFLKTLTPFEAFRAGMRVLTSACSLSLCRLLVQYLMSIKSELPQKSIEQLERIRLGVAALQCLPQQWAEKCAKLVELPSLIVESLIMAQQIVSLKKLLEEVPSLRDESLLIYYARKALGLHPDAEALPTFIESSLESTGEAKKLEKTSTAMWSRWSFHLPNVSELRHGVGLMPMTVLSGNPVFDDELRSEHTFRGVPNLTSFRVLLNLLSTSEASASAASRTASDLAESDLTQTYHELEWNAIVAHEFQRSVDVCLEVLDYADAKRRLSKASFETSEASTSFATPLEGSVLKLPTAFVATPTKHRSDTGLRLEVELLQKLLTAGIQASLTDLRDPTRCEGLLQRLVTAEQYHLSVQTAKQCSMDEQPYWEAWVIASIQEGNFMSARERVPYVFCLPYEVHLDSSRVRMEARQAAVRLVRVLEMTCPVNMPAFFALHNSLKQSRLSSVLKASAKEFRKLIRWRNPFEDEGVLLESLGFNDRMKRKDMITHAASSTLIQERIQFCEELLAMYAPGLLIGFMFRHGRGDVACQVMYPNNMEERVSRSQKRRDRTSPSRERSSSLSSSCEFASESDLTSPRMSSFPKAVSTHPPRSASLSKVAGEPSTSSPLIGMQDSGRQLSFPHSKPSARQLPPLGHILCEVANLIDGVDPYALAREIENVHQICDLSVRYMTMDALMTAMQAGGPRGHRALTQACAWLERSGHFRYLYQCQKALRRLDAAGETCIRLSWMSSDNSTAVDYLERAKKHFHDALDALQYRRETDDIPISKTKAELTSLVAKVTLQLLVYDALLPKDTLSIDSQWTPKSSTMFTENDPPNNDDLERRMAIVKQLLGQDFSLGFRVIFEFRLPETEAYCSTIASMALERNHKAILDLVNNIKGTISDSQLDQILFHAVSAYDAIAQEQIDDGWTYWFAEGLVELMISPHAKVRAFLKLNNADAAFKLAKLHGAHGDLRLVMEFAERAGYRAMVRHCEKILGRAHLRTS